MENDLQRWPLRSNFRMFHLRVATLICALILLLYIVGAEDPLSTHWLLPLIGGGCTTFYLFQRKRHQYAPVPSISISNGKLSIPKYFGANYEIPMSELRSVEHLTNSDGVVAIILGRKRQHAIVVESSRFESQVDFDQFASCVDQAFSEHSLKEKDGMEIHSITKKNSQRDVVTATLAIVIVTIYILTAGSDIEQISQRSLADGALLKSSFDTTELYRFATSFFLHYNPVHLGLNLLSLAVLAKYIYALLGSYRLTNALLLSSLSGSVLSLLFSPYEMVIGASGGIFGLLGSYLVLRLKYAKQLPGSVFVPTAQLITILALQVAADLMYESTDIASHLGGVFGGALYSTWIMRRRSIAIGADPSRTERYVALAAAASYSCALIYFLGKTLRLAA